MMQHTYHDEPEEDLIEMTLSVEEEEVENSERDESPLIVVLSPPHVSSSQFPQRNNREKQLKLCARLSMTLCAAIVVAILASMTGRPNRSSSGHSDGTGSGIVATNTNNYNNQNRHRDRRSDNSNLTQTELDFIDSHCDMRGSSVTWYPNENEKWQLHAPYVILLSDDGSVAKTLANHAQFQPTVATPQSNGFLLSLFTRQTSTSKTPVQTVRTKMYASSYRTNLLKQREVPENGEDQNGEENEAKNINTPPLLAMDATSDYLFYDLAHNFLCVTPWSYMVAHLVPPVQRIVQQWRYHTEHHHLTLSLEEWIAPELKILTQVGLIRDKDDSSSIDEDVAWKTYQQKANALPCAVGRSLYVFQLKPWFEAYQESGKAIADDWLVLGQNVHENANRLQSHLELESEVRIGSAYYSKVEMDEFTQTTLVDLFEPYNRKLDELLTSVGLPPITRTWNDV